MKCCGAKTRVGSPCQKPPLQGKERCRLHGGLSLQGSSHPNYRHGNRSKARIEKVRQDRNRLRLLARLSVELGMIA